MPKRNLDQDARPKRPRTDDVDLADLFKRGMKRGMEGDFPVAKRVRFTPKPTPRQVHERRWARVMEQMAFMTRDTRALEARNDMFERVCEVTRNIARRWGTLQGEHAALEAENERLEARVRALERHAAAAARDRQEELCRMRRIVGCGIRSTVY